MLYSLKVSKKITNIASREGRKYVPALPEMKLHFRWRLRKLQKKRIRMKKFLIN
jgi:hypothetical protein